MNGEAQLEALHALRSSQPEDRYLHWDKLRRLDPPAGLTSEQWWLGLKAGRAAEARLLPCTDKGGAPFRYGLPDSVLKRLHRVDQRASGEVAMDEVVTSERQAGQRFLVNSLMEEAIRSSQLEGATTSRRVAKEMLRTGRQPRDRGEWMIANNYRALQFIREEMGGRLDLDALLELHRIVTEGTLDDPSAAGRMQRQLALLTDAVRNPDGAYTFGSHATSHRVTHETARSDLSDLNERGLLRRRSKGRGYIFEPIPDLAERLKESPA